MIEIMAANVYFVADPIAAKAVETILVRFADHKIPLQTP